MKRALRASWREHAALIAACKVCHILAVTIRSSTEGNKGNEVTARGCLNLRCDHQMVSRLGVSGVGFHLVSDSSFCSFAPVGTELFRLSDDDEHLCRGTGKFSMSSLGPRNLPRELNKQYRASDC